MALGRSGRLRIIAGAWRSRRLAFPGRDDLRPTPDRVRETLFNWLQADVAGSRCLDMFAGSGALGFEAASRGAGQVVMIEQDGEAAAALRRNIDLLGAGNIELVTGDALHWLERNRRSFDIVFLDPPFGSGVISRCCELLERGQSLSEHAKIYVEHAAGGAGFAVPAAWECLKAKTAGQVAYKLYRRTG